MRLNVMFLHAAKSELKYNFIKLQANKFKIYKQKYFSN